MLVLRLKKLASFKTWMSHSLSTVKSAMKKIMKILIASSPTQTTLGSTETLHCRIGRQGAHTVSWIRQVMVFHLSTIRLETRLTLTPNLGRSGDPECWLSACLNEPQTCRAFRRKSGRPCADDKTGDHDNDNGNDNDNDN